MRSIHNPPEPNESPIAPALPRNSKKQKFVAGILAFFFPGIGHFYLGLIQRGFVVLLGFILNAAALVYSFSYNVESLPMSVLLGLMLPSVYFFNIFDALQCTDRVNVERMYGTDLQNASSVNRSQPSKLQRFLLGIFVILSGMFLFLWLGKPSWLQVMFTNGGPYFGAVFLIVAGFIVLFRSRK